MPSNKLESYILRVNFLVVKKSLLSLKCFSAVISFEIDPIRAKPWFPPFDGPPSRPALPRPLPHPPTGHQGLSRSRAATPFSHPVVGRQPLLQGGGELLWKLSPCLLTNLILESMQYFVKHILQIGLKKQQWKYEYLTSKVEFNLISTCGFNQLATASQKKMKSGTTPLGLTLIIWHMPRKAESFSSLSRMLRRLVHQGRTNWSRDGATIWGHTSPIRPMVMAVFSSSVLGVLGRLMMVMSGPRMGGM